jgi:hypothetical protein
LYEFWNGIDKHGRDTHVSHHMNMSVIDLSYWWFIHLSNLSCECRAWEYLAHYSCLFLGRIQTNQYITTMVLDSLSSPHRRSQNTFFVSSAKKPQSSRDDSWSALVERHRFLLTTLLVLAFLCTVYLYFAVTLGASDACTGLTGAERIECQARSVLQHGKLKFRWLWKLIDEDQIIEFYMHSGHMTNSWYHVSVYGGVADVIGPQNLLYW